MKKKWAELLRRLKLKWLMFITRQEPCTCPRRGEGGPWDASAKNEDAWEHGRLRWGTRDSDKWRWSWKPRTCSFCGGVCPVDAFKLLKEGWELEIAKGYKLYLYPPGYTEWLDNFSVTMKGLSKDDDVWSPVPPVKLYTMHYTPEEVEELNAILFRQRTKNKKLTGLGAQDDD